MNNLVDFLKKECGISITMYKRFMRVDFINILCSLSTITFMSLSLFYFDYNKILLVCLGTQISMFFICAFNLFMNFNDYKYEKDYLKKLLEDDSNG
jgi:hypothetical protein